MNYLRKFYSSNIDQVAGYFPLLIILLYVIAFGRLQIGHVVIENFQPFYLVILIPIWIIDSLKSSIESFIPRQYKTSEQDLNKIAVIIACKDGEGVVGKTIENLLERFHPKQIVIASNGSTDRTCEVARSYGVVCLDFKEPLGKVRAINAALSYVIAPYVLLLDDDTLVNDAEMPTGLLDKGYDAVAFRVYVKQENWVSTFQMHEYRKTSDLGKRYHNKNASVQNISGAVGLFKREILEAQIEKHTGEFAGEDLQRTLLIHLTTDRSKKTKAHRGIVLAKSIVTTQAPNTLKVLFKQRVFGWYPGLYSNFTNYMKILFAKNTPTALRVDAFYNCFLVMILDIVRLLSLPIMIFYPWYFVITYVTYFLFECIPYFRNGATEPFWVILFYPIYGLFGFATRICAMAVFIYRRVVVYGARIKYLDGYRGAPAQTKLISFVFTTVILVTFLVLNVAYNFSGYFLNLPIKL